MSDEPKIPEDDGQRRPHLIDPGDGIPNLLLLAGGKPMTREEAIRELRQSPPKELKDAAECALFDDPGDGQGFRALGKVRARHNMTDLVLSTIGQRLTISMPSGDRR